MAVPSLSDDSAFATWNGPTTLFAPTDASIRSCSSCSVVRLLREHIVPGLFSHEYLKKLAFGTKIETMDPGRCITVTSSNDVNNVTRIYVGGVEITRPDLFNNGLVVVHGLQGYVAPLSPFSCNVERMTSLSFPIQVDNRQNNVVAQNANHQESVQYPSYIMRLMLRDAMLRLRNSGFSILALAMKLKSVELMNLQNITVFALDDVSIFAGSHSRIVLLAISIWRSMSVWPRVTRRLLKAGAVANGDELQLFRYDAVRLQCECVVVIAVELVCFDASHGCTLVSYWNELRFECDL
ncbi:fasciclin-like arabinogalactan protein 21 [Tanacetum coccineum]|uniref:Fasciclin-like arabinogalactan protein 21 n=1 Tax=Tanacetum coccineum TaxID=301880 RepID=A0ABQ5ECH2_9ASTR